MEKLEFTPLPGLKSPHLQMIVANYAPAGREPDYIQNVVPLSDGDNIVLAVSEPEGWKPPKPTIALLHGLGGDFQSKYLIRLSRKFVQLGFKVIRVNLRGCGSGKSTSNLPYHCGLSLDIKEVIEHISIDNSPLYLIGFSMSGNIILKMAGEYQTNVKKIIAICPLIDLKETADSFLKPEHKLYHKYYLNNFLNYGEKWAKGKDIQTNYDFDRHITVPLWGFASPEDYYSSCSSLKFIPRISIDTQILFAEDDPFVNFRKIEEITLPKSVKVATTAYGSHIGFIGQTKNPYDYFWMDEKIIDWVEEAEKLRTD